MSYAPFAAIASATLLLAFAPSARAVCVGGAPNGSIQTGEACDDGNSASNDGCDPACNIESGWACDRPVSFNTIDSESYPGSNANWNISNGGRTGTQTVNTGHGTFGLMGADAWAATYTFEIAVVDGGGDDDFIGFVLGFNPGETGFGANTDYFIIDWKKNDQASGGFPGPKGLALLHVTNTPTFTDLWTHRGPVAEVRRGATLGSVGWVTAATNSFEITNTQNTLRVFVNGTQQFNLTASDLGLTGGFPPGEIGFYGLSQANVQYTVTGPFGHSLCNRPPTPGDYTVTASAGGPIVIDVTTLFSDPDGTAADPSSSRAVTQPGNASATGASGGPDGTITITPDSDAGGQVFVLDYELCDAHPTVPLCGQGHIVVTIPTCTGASCDAPLCADQDPVVATALPVDLTCVAEREPGVLDPIVEWGSAPNPVYSGYNQIMMTPVVGNLTDDNGDGVIDGNDVPDVVFTAFLNSGYNSGGVLTALSGDTGALLWTMSTINGYSVHGSGGVAIGDLDGDGLPEILVESLGGLCDLEVAAPGGPVTTAPEFRWRVANASGNGTFPAIADLDGDGKAEVMSRGAVYTYTGALIGSTGGAGLGFAYAADVIGDQRLEVIDGNAIYSVSGSPGALSLSLATSSGGSGGYTALGDFDGDGRAEVVIVTNASHTVTLWDPDGATDADAMDGWTKTIADGGSVANRGGPPTVADFDGDGLPEIGIAAEAAYIVFDTDGSVLWTQATHDASSRFTGSSVFDFEGDGRAEVVYADQEDLFIYDGPTGAKRFVEPSHASGTLWEYPLVVDVDNDGQSEIVLASNNYGYPGEWTGIHVFGSQTNSWAPARPIWNQHAYSISNVEDDGGIPQYQTPNWTVWNSFRAAGRNEGQGQWQADLMVTGLGACVGPCADWTTPVTLSIANRGRLDASDVVVAFRRDSAAGTPFLTLTAPSVPSGGAVLFGPVALSPEQWGPGDLVVTVAMPNPADECDTSNNAVVIGRWPNAITDPDGDRRDNSCDNCDTVANADQADLDNDGLGDVCDLCTDADHDGWGVAVGACQTGAGGCTQGCGDCADDNSSIYPGRLEECDGADNDCDGLTDAADAGVELAPCGKQDGVCAGALTPRDRCVGGAWQACTPADYASHAFPASYDPSGDVCDGFDNDCDGGVDENAVAIQTACGVGACGRVGQLLCQDGDFVDTCSPATAAPSDTSCNGQDDDCDGGTDEEFSPQETSCGQGACHAIGVLQCTNGNLINTCTAGTPAVGDATCNAVDDDCDGQQDEDYQTGVIHCGVGSCAATGQRLCAQGHVVETCVPGTAAPSDADCDGQDDDCNGSIDDGFVPVDTSCGVGACARTGKRTCAEGGGVVDSCLPGVAAPSDTSCNGVDDDCDGQTDEDFVPQPTVCGTGVCAATGQRVCDRGGLVDTCTVRPQTGNDGDCDGLDDDCDGVTDEAYLSTNTSCGLGACRRAGQKTCAAGQEVDSCSVGAPSDEVCDAVDNDCDGLTDASDTDLVRVSCAKQGGVCAGSLHPASLCVNGAWLECTTAIYGQHAYPAVYATTDTTCDAVDNDCDGLTDDEYPVTQTTCGVGRCANTHGQKKCQGGGVVDTCNPLASAISETCNGADDNCNGYTDETFPTLGQGCDGPDADSCKAGVVVCKPDGSGAVCDEAPGTVASERCDGIDNDCDGATDEGCDDDFDDWCDADMACVTGVSIPVCPNGCGDCNDTATGVNPARAEACDGIDNDCDGLIDEGCDDDGDDWCDAAMACQATAASAVCPHGCGDCADGNAAVHPNALEPCDGLDNDCDGVADEGFQVGGSCQGGLGQCVRAGHLVCDSTQGGVVCDATPTSGSAELCDGLDNDCDGDTDEIYPVGESCTVGLGVCARDGAWFCAGGGAVCSATPGPKLTEVCDGLDDDCDGFVDSVGAAGAVCDALETAIVEKPQAVSGAVTAQFGYVDPVTPANTRFECSLDGGAWFRCDGGAVSFTALSEGTHTFLVRSLGGDGAVDPTPAYYTWLIDQSVPDTIIALAPDDPSQGTTAHFAFEATVTDVAGYWCALDPATEPPAPGAYVPCDAVTSYTGLSEGPHALWVYVVNEAGTADPSPASHHWTIDLSAPETEIVAGPPAVTSDGSATLVYRDPGDGSVATFRCRLDGGAWTPCDGGTVSYGELEDGEYVFEVAAVDGSGIVDPTPASWRWVVDSAPPDTFIPIHPTDPAQTGDAGFAFASDEVGASYLCALDPATTPPEAWEPCDATLLVTGLTDGTHTLWVAAVDGAGNVDPTPATYTWLVDTIAPDTEITSGPPARTGPDDGATFAYRSPDEPALTTFECRLDGGAWAACDGGATTVAAEGLAVGGHVLAVRACDPASGLCDPTPAVVSWEVTTSSCPLDAVGPELVCAGPQLVECVDGGGTLDLGAIAATASDACGVGAVTWQGPEVFGVGVTPVVFVAADGNGNRGSCVTEVSVVDSTPPSITCGDAVGLTTSAETCGAVAELDAPVVSDLCRGTDVVVYEDAPAVFPVGDTTVTWTALDPGGAQATCAIVVTVVDDDPATLSCEQEVSEEAPADRCGWAGAVEATARDNCATEVTTLSEDNDYPVGESVVHFTATDASGNVATCDTTLTVADVTDPVVTCPEGGEDDAPGGFDVVVSDACDAAAGIDGIVCEQLDATGAATPMNLADCPVAVTEGTLTVTGRLAEGILRVSFTATGEDASGNTGAAECALVFSPDYDGDGVLNADDNCVEVANTDQADGDEDGVGDACDVCVAASNADQVDTDKDGLGDACDLCIAVRDPQQGDVDGDGVGDACDVCPTVADVDQADGDANGVGDACQDSDEDGVLDTLDLCPEDADPAQLDSDDDGEGDACDLTPYSDYTAQGGGGCASGPAGGALPLALGCALLTLAWIRRRRRAQRAG